MAKKKKSETIEDILDRMEQDIESIREKVEENMDEDSDIDEEDEE